MDYRGVCVCSVAMLQTEPPFLKHPCPDVLADRWKGFSNLFSQKMEKDRAYLMAMGFGFFNRCCEVFLILQFQMAYL